METRELLMTAARSLALYAILLLVVRLLGKRTVGNFTAFDLLVALMLGEVVDEIIYGDVTFLQGIVVIGAIAVAQYGNAWLSYRNHRAARVLEGLPVPIVRHGELQPRGMRQERMNEQDVMAALRLQGIEDRRDVKLAVVEVDGIVSVLREEWAEPLQRADFDLEAAAERARRRANSSPVVRVQTDSASMLGEAGV